MASYTGKIETLGSVFNQETRRGYWRPPLHQIKSISIPIVFIVNMRKLYAFPHVFLLCL